MCGMSGAAGRQCGGCKGVETNLEFGTRVGSPWPVGRFWYTNSFLV